MRATGDLDIAVALERWAHFEKVKNAFEIEFEFRKTNLPHRLITPLGVRVDVLPFGEIEDPEGTIEWPGSAGFKFSTGGFQEAFQAAQNVTLDKRLVLKVATVPGIALLKLIAWSDDRSRRRRDAVDLSFLMRTYEEILGMDFYRHHGDLVDEPNFDVEIASATALGRDVGKLMTGSTDLASRVLEILETATGSVHESRLAEDMGGDTIPEYSQRFACLVGFRNGIVRSLTSG